MSEDLERLLGVVEEGDQLIEERARGFRVDRVKLFEKMAKQRTADNATGYILDLLDFAMQNNAGSVHITTRPKQFTMRIDKAGLSKQQVEAALALAFQPITDGRFAQIIGLARGIGANLGDEHLKRLLIDTNDGSGAGYAREFGNLLEKDGKGFGESRADGPESETDATRRESELSGPGFHIDIQRDSPRYGEMGRMRRFFGSVVPVIKPSLELTKLEDLRFYTDVDIRVNGKRRSLPYELRDALISHKFARSETSGVIGIPRLRGTGGGMVDIVRNGVLKDRFNNRRVEHERIDDRIGKVGLHAIINSPHFTLDLGGNVIRDEKFFEVLDTVGEEILQLYLNAHDGFLECLRAVHKKNNYRYVLKNRSDLRTLPLYYEFGYDADHDKKLPDVEEYRLSLLSFLEKNIPLPELLSGQRTMLHQRFGSAPLLRQVRQQKEDVTRGVEFPGNGFLNFLADKRVEALVSIDDVIATLDRGSEVFVQTSNQYPENYAKGITLYAPTTRESAVISTLLAAYKAKRQTATATAETQVQRPGLVRRMYDRIASRKSAQTIDDAVDTGKDWSGTIRVGRNVGIAVGTAGALAAGSVYLPPVLAGAGTAIGVVTTAVVPFLLPAAGVIAAGAGVYAVSKSRLVRDKNGKKAIIPHYSEKTFNAIDFACGYTWNRGVVPTMRTSKEYLLDPAARVTVGALKVLGGAAVLGGYALYQGARAIGIGTAWTARKSMQYGIVPAARGIGAAVSAVGDGVSWSARQSVRLLTPPAAMVRDATVISARATRKAASFGLENLVLKPIVRPVRNGTGWLFSSITEHRHKTAQRKRQESAVSLLDKLDAAMPLLQEYLEMFEQNKEYLSRTLIGSSNTKYLDAFPVKPVISLVTGHSRYAAEPIIFWTARSAEEYGQLSSRSSGSSFGAQASDVAETLAMQADRARTATKRTTTYRLSLRPSGGGSENARIFLNIDHPLVQGWMSDAREGRLGPITRQSMLTSSMLALESIGSKIIWSESQGRMRTQSRMWGDDYDAENRGQKVRDPDSPRPVAQQLRHYREELDHAAVRKRMGSLIDIYSNKGESEAFRSIYETLSPQYREEIVRKIYGLAENRPIIELLERIDLPMIERVGRTEI